MVALMDHVKRKGEQIPLFPELLFINLFNYHLLFKLDLGLL